MKVILEAGKIPIGSIVTKPTGEKQYKLIDKLKVYGATNLQQELITDDNTRFLINFGDDGFSPTINVVSNTTELRWVVSDKELYQYLYNLTQCDHK